MADNSFVKIGTALLKHQVKKLVGEEAMGLAHCDDGPPYYYKVAYEEAERMMKTKSANPQDFFNGIDRARLETLKPVELAIVSLNPPILRLRRKRSA